MNCGGINNCVGRERLAQPHTSHAKLREHFNAPWAPFTKPLSPRSRPLVTSTHLVRINVLSEENEENITLACCPWNSGIWQTAKTRFVTLLRNSNTQHQIPFRAPPTFGKFVNSLSGEASHARMILDSCYGSMSAVGANMRLRSSTKARLC